MDFVEKTYEQLLVENRVLQQRIAAYEETIDTLKKGEQDARERQAELEAIYHSVPIGLCVLDNQLRFIRINENMAEMNGASIEDHIGHSVHDMLPDIGEQAEQAMKRILETGEPLLSFEIGGETAAYPGETRYWLEKWLPLKNEQGKIIGISVVAEEVTNRKRADEAMQHQNAVTKGINRILNEGLTYETEEEWGKTCLDVARELTQSEIGFIGEVNRQGRLHNIAVIGPAWELCQLPDGTVHTDPPKDLVIDGIFGQVLHNSKSVFTNNPKSYPTRIVLPEAHPPLQSFIGIPLIHNGNTIGMVGLGNKEKGYSNEDVETLEALTQAMVLVLMHRRAEWSLALSKEKYRTLAERLRDVDLAQSEERFYKAFYNSPAIMAILSNVDDRIIDLNAKWEILTGYHRDEALGKTSIELGLWDEQSESARAIQTLKIDGELNETELKVKKKCGEVRTIMAKAVEITINGEKCRLTVSRDITEQQKYEAEIASLGRLNLVGKMAASIGHEIRNPMTSVRGFLQMLSQKEKYADDEEYFMLMIEELDRANSIIINFLSLAGDKSVDLQKVNLNAILHNLYPLIKADAVITDMTVHLVLDETLPTLLLDNKEMRQLILNLTRNALEAMQPGGVLTIRTAVENGEVILEVEDQGSGISPELISRLGTPFESTKDNGTGLGLAICYSIAHRHNARIEMETRPGRTVFRVSFSYEKEQLPVEQL